MSHREVSKVGDLCRSPVVTVRASDSLRVAAERMTRAGVGCVVVEHERRPIAILTDRDLALAALCEGLDVEATAVEKVMGRVPITVSENESLQGAAQCIGAARVRRLPVVNIEGLLVGLLSADDLMHHAAERLSRIGAVLGQQLGECPEGVCA